MKDINVSKKFLIILCILEALVIGYLLSERSKPIPPQPDIPVKEIVRDSIIRDSIFIEIEKIKKEYIYINDQYKKDSIDIMSANDSVLFDSFSRYIEDFNNK
jgi:hypothetical protein